jgi:hypothetical protein
MRRGGIPPMTHFTDPSARAAHVKRSIGCVKMVGTFQNTAYLKKMDVVCRIVLQSGNHRS